MRNESETDAPNAQHPTSSEPPAMNTAFSIHSLEEKPALAGASSCSVSCSRRDVVSSDTPSTSPSPSPSAFLRDSVCVSVGIDVGESVSIAVGRLEGEPLGAALGTVEGTCVGLELGAREGPTDGIALGFTVGVAEGCLLGSRVFVFVGDCDGGSVGL